MSWQDEKPKRKEKPKNDHREPPRRWWPWWRWVILTMVVVVAYFASTTINFELFFQSLFGQPAHVAVTLPTAAPTPIPVPTRVHPWAGYHFLSQAESLALRTQTNAINLAVLRTNGDVNFSSEYSFHFSRAPLWHLANPIPYGFQTLTTSGSAVELQIFDQTYHLNELQPFAVDQTTHLTEVYVVDLQGQLWLASLSDLRLEEIQATVAVLPQPIAANPNLSFTFQ